MKQNNPHMSTTVHPSLFSDGANSFWRGDYYDHPITPPAVSTSPIAVGKIEFGPNDTLLKTQQAGTAIKFDQNKLPLHLLSTEAMNQTAAVLQFGAKKYAEHNWRKGFAWSRPLAAAMRHITAFNNGEDKDPESGLSHLAHAACCIMFLLEFEKTHKHLDDRYKADTDV